MSKGQLFCRFYFLIYPNTILYQVGSGKIPMTCDQLEELHHAFVIARIAYHCPDSSADGALNPSEKPECEAKILHNAIQICAKQKAKPRHCMFNEIQQIKDQEGCHPANETICNVMHRLISFPQQARQAFCKDSIVKRGHAGPGASCNLASVFQCTEAVISAALACVPEGELGPGGVFQCVVGFLGAAKEYCTPCICTIAGNIIPGLCS